MSKVVKSTEIGALGSYGPLNIETAPERSVFLSEIAQAVAGVHKLDLSSAQCLDYQAGAWNQYSCIRIPYLKEVG